MGSEYLNKRYTNLGNYHAPSGSMIKGIKMRITRLLTIFFILFCPINIPVWGQCSLITKNGSSQDPKTVCAPVDFTMNVWFKFIFPVDTSRVQIRFIWNDGTGAVTTMEGYWNSSMDSVWAEASHIYPPTDECSITADAYLIYDGVMCTSSGHQEQTFSVWGTDEENGGVLSTNPIVAYVCEGEDIVNITFDDNSFFNCNISIEHDNPNQYFRWVQFVYNTYTQAGDRIPSVTVNDGMGSTYNMTDGAGNYISNLYGPIEVIPIPADFPNQTSYAISAPAGGVAGDIFEITLRNWNVCNPYDNYPSDGIPPADLVNGDNPPITTTARIEIIAPPPVTTQSLRELCTGESVILTASAGSAQIRWYNDSTLTNLLYTGNNYNPTLPPFNLDNSIPGNYTFWVSSYDGMCESAPDKVNVVLYETPAAVFAGNDIIVCDDSILLSATPPSAGSGLWTTSGTAIFADNTNPVTWAYNLNQGPNTFTWTVRNGICYSSDNVVITSDWQPSPAYAGQDDSLCAAGNIILNATPPDHNGQGHWLILSGAGNISDNTAHNAAYSNASPGFNSLLWRVSSDYGACPVTSDTVTYFVDLPAGIADAGPDIVLCEYDFYTFSANYPINGGNGIWTILSGSTSITDVGNPESFVSNLSEGDNEYSWTLSSLYGLCSSSSDNMIITRDLTPGIASAGPDISLCLENSDTLGGNAPIRGTGEWQIVVNPSGTDPVFSPDRYTPDAVLSVLPGNEGLYILQWVLQNNSCISYDTMTVDFGIPPPPGFAGNDTTVCSLSANLHSNTFAQGYGMWTQLTGSAMAVFMPDRYDENAMVTVPAGGEGLYAFEWRLMSGACAPSSDTVEITFFGIPETPVTTGAQSCGPDSLYLTALKPDPQYIVEWFNSPSDPVAFHQDEHYMTPWLINTQVFWVASYDTSTGCRSPRVTIDAEIFQIPDPPAISGDTICGPGIAHLNSEINPPATTLLWYSDSLLTHQIGTGNNLNLWVNDDSVIWVIASDAVHGCNSSQIPFNIIVHPAILPPVAVNDSSCGPADLEISVNSTAGNEIYWYDAPSAGNLILIDTLMDLTNQTLSVTFWVSEINDSTGCYSSRIPVEGIINTIPGIPVLDNINACGPGTFTLVPTGDANTTTFRWYSQPVGGSLILEDDSLVTGYISSGRSYWFSGYNELTGCEGPREQVDINIFPIPGPIIITGQPLVVRGQSGVPYFTHNTPGSLYTWSIPPGINMDANGNSVVWLSFPNTGLYTISVFETNSYGCTGSPVDYLINVITDSVSVEIGAYNQVACMDHTFEIRPHLYGGTMPYYYQWTGDIAWLSVTDDLNTDFIPTATGTYHLYLQVTDAYGKNAYDSVEITVYTSPTATITTRDQVVCVGDELQLRVNTSGYDAFSHQWTGPTHNLSSTTIKEPVFTAMNPDTIEYFYYLTDIHGCTAMDSVTIFTDITLANFMLLTSPGCSPLNMEFLNLSQRSVSYFWDFGDGSTSPEENPVHTFVNESQEAHSFQVTLRTTSRLGCTGIMQQYTTVWPNPVATLNALPESSCSPAHITLFSTPANLRYHWDFGNGESEVTESFMVIHDYIAEGELDRTYRVKVVTESELHCFDSTYLDLAIYASPVADFTITPPFSTFPENEFSITNQTEGNRWSYHWNFGDGNHTWVSDPGTIEYEAPGNYTVTLTASSEFCSDSIDKTIYLYPAEPQAKFAPPEPGCMPHTINFVNASEYADEYLWEFGDGSISTSPNPTYTYYQAGIYRVKLTVRGPGGESAFSDTARIYILPNAFFDLAPRYVYVNDEPVYYFNLSEEADVFEWDFGDGTTSTELNPQHKYREEGTYDVTLKVWTDHQCFDLYVMQNAVFVEPSGRVEFPNAFRPASPLEENQVFLPGVIDHVEEYHLMIFNRWGELIFESFDQEIGWNGTFKGEPAKQDVYVWKVTGTYTDGKGFSKTGDVTLMY